MDALNLAYYGGSDWREALEGIAASLAVASSPGAFGAVVIKM